MVLQEYPNVTVRQLDMMLHAIGLNAQSIKRGSFEVWRNWYAAGSDDADEWDKLVGMGFARKYDGTYSVTKRFGFVLLELLGIRLKFRTEKLEFPNAETGR